MINLVYVVMINDRHADPDVLVFSTKELAIEAAKNAVTECARHEEDIQWDYELNPSMIRHGWIFYVPYSCEGDSVRVMERELDKP